MFHKLIQRFLADQRSFRRHNDSQYIFYPWQYPGEGIVLDAGEAREIAFYLTLGFSAFLTIILISLSAEILGLVSHKIGDYLYLNTFLWPVPIYVLCMHRVKKNRKFVLLPVSERLPNKTFRKYLIISLLQVVGLITATSSVSWLFIAIYVVSMIFTNYFVFRVIKTRGYFFKHG